MNELLDIKEQLDFTISEITNGFMTIIRHETGITHRSQIECLDNETIISAHLYDENELYNVSYIHLDENGQLLEVLHEKEGVLPNLFIDEHKNSWCLLTDTSSDKNLEFVVPLKNRFAYTKPNGKRQFPGKFVGLVNNIALFHDCDIYFSKSPDKLLKIELKNDNVKLQKQLKIPIPLNNKIFIDQDNNLQLLARQEDKLIHRKCDLNGNVHFERTIPFILFNSFEVIRLNEEDDSKIIFAVGNKINLSVITPDSKTKNSVIFENQSDIFNIWKPLNFDKDISLIKFNFEKGNGWLIIKEDKLIDCFIHNDFGGYKSMVTDEIIKIPHSDLILSDITMVGREGYCVTIYPRNENPKKNNEIIILNKRIMAGNNVYTK